MMLEDRFSELVTKEFINELTPAEAAELDALLNEKRLRDRYDILKLYLSNTSTDRSADDVHFEKALLKIAETEKIVPLHKISRKKTYWAAASIAVLFLLAALSGRLLLPAEKVATQWVTTKRATRKSIVLSDGTKVQLNSASRLFYPKGFNGKNREVTLIGEAFFDVTKDPDHPFIIHTAKMDVRVLGTAFNVKAYADDRFSETTLIRGKVEVIVKDRPADKITLKPSEKLIVKYLPSRLGLSNAAETDDALTEITHFQKSDTTIVETSWVYNKLAFQDMSFEQIAKMIERTYDIKIVFKKEDLKELKFTGTFEHGSADDVLKALSVIEPFNYTIKNKQVLIQ